jgi:phage-related tail fiber protein
MTTSGDTIYGGASGAATRLPKGTDGQVLTLAAGLPAWVAPTGGASSNIVGSMILFPAAITAPTTHLRCNGAAVSRTTYSALFAVIGTTFGAGDGSTTFNLPTSAINGEATFCMAWS